MSYPKTFSFSVDKFEAKRALKKIVLNMETIRNFTISHRRNFDTWNFNEYNEEYLFNAYRVASIITSFYKNEIIEVVKTLESEPFLLNYDPLSKRVFEILYESQEMSLSSSLRRITSDLEVDERLGYHILQAIKYTIKKKPMPLQQGIKPYFLENEQKHKLVTQILGHDFEIASRKDVIRISMFEDETYADRQTNVFLDGELDLEELLLLDMYPKIAPIRGEEHEEPFGVVLRWDDEEISSLFDDVYLDLNSGEYDDEPSPNTVGGPLAHPFFLVISNVLCPETKTLYFMMSNDEYKNSNTITLDSFATNAVTNLDLPIKLSIEFAKALGYLSIVTHWVPVEHSYSYKTLLKLGFKQCKKEKSTFRNETDGYRHPKQEFCIDGVILWKAL
ncbi:MAG: hypothetical protein ACTSVB_00650 [Candidatus Heimdallarchaeaceae archaeon]